MTKTYNNSNATNDYTDPGNWDTFATPIAGDDAVIPVAGGSGDITCDNIAFNADTNGGSTFTASNTITITVPITGFAANFVAASIVVGGAVSAGNFTATNITINANVTGPSFTASGSWTIGAGFILASSFAGAATMSFNASVIGQGSPIFSATCPLIVDAATTYVGSNALSGGTALVTFLSGCTIDGGSVGTLNGPVVVQSGCTTVGSPTFNGTFTGTDITFGGGEAFGSDVTYTSSTPFTWTAAIPGNGSFNGPVAVGVTIGGSSATFENGAHPTVTQTATVHLLDTLVLPETGSWPANLYCNGSVVISGLASTPINLSGTTINVQSGTTVIAAAGSGGITVDGTTNFVVAGGAKGYAFGATIPGSSSLGGGPIPMIGSPLIRFLSAA